MLRRRRPFAASRHASPRRRINMLLSRAAENYILCPYARWREKSVFFGVRREKTLAV